MRIWRLAYPFCENCVFAKLKTFMYVEIFMKSNLDLKAEFVSLGFHLPSNVWKMTFHLSLFFELVGLHFHGSWCSYAVCGIIITSLISEVDGLVCCFSKKLLLYSNITSNVNGSRMQNFQRSFIFIYIYISIIVADGELFLFLSTICTRSRIFNIYL